MTSLNGIAMDVQRCLGRIEQDAVSEPVLFKIVSSKTWSGVLNYVIQVLEVRFEDGMFCFHVFSTALSTNWAQLIGQLRNLSSFKVLLRVSKMRQH